MPRRVSNRTFSIDDQTDADIRWFAQDMGVSQSELLRDAVRVFKIVTTLVDALGPEQYSPHRARRIALVPDGYQLPRALREAVVVVPALPQATPRTRLVELRNEEEQALDQA